MSELRPCVLALDIGTSSARAVFFDSTGTALVGGPVLQLSYPWRTMPDGAMEADADAVLTQVLRVIDAAADHAREQRFPIAAVAATAFWHSTVGIGGDGSPLTPLFAWGDTRPGAAAARLRSRLDDAATHRRTGCFLDASYPAARLLWLREERPDIFPRVSHWISFAEYLELRLFGELRCSLSMASGTGLLDGWARRWDAEVLDAAGVSVATLSPLADLDPHDAPLRREWAVRWPALAGVPWFPALGDGACANLGSGAVGPARPALTVGTTAAMRVLVEAPQPVVAPDLWCYRLDARRFVVGRALSNGGNVVAALERTLRLPPAPEREAMLAAMPADGHGLTVLPWLIGERGPGPQPAPGAAMVGQVDATSPVEVLQAWMEAVALRLADVAGAIEAALGEPAFVVAGGGAMVASPAWRRMIADALGREVVLAAATETSARGAALVVLERLGLIDDALLVDTPAGPAVEPDAARHHIYRAARERQRKLAQSLTAAGLARAVQPRDVPGT